MRAFILFGLGALTLLAGCTKDPAWPPKQQVRLVVRPVWNGTPFHKTDAHITPAQERVLVQQVKFFLSRITLLGKGTASTVSPVEILDITDGEQVRFGSVDVGAYDSLRFGLGLPPELNHGDITAVVPPSPLDFSQGMYWTWATMYRFMLFDGRYDTNAAGTGVPPYQFSIHTGRDTCYRERTIPLPLVVGQRASAEIVLDVDIGRFFGNGDQVLRLSDGPQSHGEPQSLAVAAKLSDLAIAAINAE